MKNIKLIPLFYLLLIFIFSSCKLEKKSEIPQQMNIPTITQTKIITASSTPSIPKDKISPAVTITPIPSKTKTTLPISLTPSPTFTAFLDGTLIILKEFNVNYLEDILTGRGYNLLAESTGIDILRWAGNGCTLIAATREEIVEMDLQGKILRSIFPFERFHDVVDGVILTPPSIGRRAINPLSEDGTWLAYKVGSGTREQRGDDLEPIRYEFENLETMAVDGRQGPYRLSQNGGAWRAAWSPTSAQIAYSDYDDNGIHQLFIINRDGTNRRQVTTLTYPSIEILKIIWSPEGNRIAMQVDQDGDGPVVDTIVIDIDENTYKEYENIIAKWWRDNGSFIAARLIDQKMRQEEYIVVDITTNHEFTIRSEGCYRVNPFGNPFMMGCMTLDYNFIVYDSLSGDAVVYPKFDDNNLFILDWIAAPEAYPGVDGCGYTP